tara:strand:+ start:13048 stop:13983 length:936 start_codon:yes stop_codon:yes gene_type:complete
MPNTPLKLDQISQPQQERLAYIEFRLLFLGCVNRSDLVSRFGLKEAAASRDLALYKQLASSNITYDTVERTYRVVDRAIPIFDYHSQQVLTVLADGFGDDFVASCASMLPVELPSRLNTPAVEVLAPISRALFNGVCLNVDYRSLSSGRTERELVPLALVDNGLRWHLRAYDLHRERYADFVLNRIEKAEPTGTKAKPIDLRQNDLAWQQHVDLALVPHPAQTHPDTIAFEYDMQDNQLQVSVRAALAGYLLRRWNIDCTPDHSLSGPEHLLWLSNVAELLNTDENSLDNLNIAPGFPSSAQEELNRGIGC